MDNRGEFHRQQSMVPPPTSYEDNVTPPQGTPNTITGNSNAFPTHNDNMYQDLLNANARLLKENNEMSEYVQNIMKELKDLKERVHHSE